MVGRMVEELQQCCHLVHLVVQSSARSVAEHRRPVPDRDLVVLFVAVTVLQGSRWVPRCSASVMVRPLSAEVHDLPLDKSASCRDEVMAALAAEHACRLFVRTELLAAEAGDFECRRFLESSQLADLVAEDLRRAERCWFEELERPTGVQVAQRHVDMPGDEHLVGPDVA